VIDMAMLQLIADQAAAGGKTNQAADAAEGKYLAVMAEIVRRRGKLD
jgi:hypothetical protein